MRFFWKYIFFVFFLLSVFFSTAQRVDKIILVDTSFVQLDSLSIVPESFRVYRGDIPVDDSLYTLNWDESSLTWYGQTPQKVRVVYNLFALNFAKKYYKKDTSLIQPIFSYTNPFRSNNPGAQELELFGGDNLTKSGSISRGISLGNAQDLGVNSNFNLQLSGKIGEGVSVLASVTDENIPIQPDGNTQQLQDFDNVFIQLTDDKWKLIAGDYSIERFDSHYMRYRKKSMGLFYSNSFQTKDSKSISLEVGAAVSRGKYRIQFFQGIEGNQGPYKLTGADNELFVLILSGTEQVFVDGVLLQRGADHDYIIDYNSAEIIFTPKFLITKNKRIEVQFQYTDRNYLRSIANAQTHYKNKNSETFLRVYSEQDHKNQPLFQELEDSEKALMSVVGNDVTKAFIQRESPVGEDENVVSYIKIDSLGYSVYLHAPTSDTTLYRVQFSDVGSGNGNYIREGFSPFGNVYKWVKPDTVSGTIVQYGNYVPAILLITPKRKQLITLENNFKVNKNLQIKTDLALSNEDVNTFSEQGNNQNIGMGSRVEMVYSKKVSEKKNSALLQSGGSIDFTSIHFSPVEKFRAIEFNRNWNLGFDEITTPLVLGNFNIGLQKDSVGKFTYNLDVLDLGKQFRGIKNDFSGQGDWNNTEAKYAGSLLISEGESNTQFYRHKSVIEQKIGTLILGYKDEVEQNLFLQNDSILPASYSFYDGRIYLKREKKPSRFYSLYYGYRNEKMSRQATLVQSAYSHEAGVDYQLKSNNNRTQLKGNVAYRQLVPTESIVGIAPENTFLNQTNFSTSFWKQLVSLNTFYSVGSGLEQKREFLYVEVNPGQGVFTWIDYNENGTKEINEFEVAAFQDQANYIRVFTQSNDYIQTFSNQFTQSIAISPRTLLQDKTSKFYRFLSKISSVSAAKIDRKTTFESPNSSLNPFATNLNDSNLVSLNNQLRSSLFFNRTGYKYGVEVSFQQTGNKVLLSNGFDSRESTIYGVNLRCRFDKFLVKIENEATQKILNSDFLASRNFELETRKIAPTLTYQKGANFNLDFLSSYEEKTNLLEGEFASLTSAGARAKYTIVNKLNLVAGFNFIAISFSGAPNSSLEYEMLEGLKRGNNMTWELLLNRKIGKNLDLSISYNGRKPEDFNTIHAGTIEVRAFF